MTHIVNRRKANKSKMLKALDAELESNRNAIEQLLDAQLELHAVRKILVGRDGVEMVGAYYNENEEALIDVLPNEVIRLYNPYTS